jgi:hypothetical protein
MNYSNIIIPLLVLSVLGLALVGHAIAEQPSSGERLVGTPAILTEVTAQSPSNTLPQPLEAAQTPADFRRTPFRQPNRIQTIGDTITFEEFATGTIITDQYINYGVVFSGLETDQDPIIHDYGPATLGRILHSYDWYGAIVVRFVNPLNSEDYRPVRRISFDNAGGSDYIVVKIYNSQDSLIYSHTSFGAEHLDIKLADYQAAYMVLDDSLETAYAFDNLYIDHQPDDDMITFSEYAGGAVITDQYTDQGIVFSGLLDGQDPRIQEYSPETWGNVLRSFDWYGPILANFVDPENPENPQYVGHISFDNPIDTEIDYINVKVYNLQDELLYNYTSKSPERVSIDLGKPVAAYMIIEDSAGTAFIIDNLRTDNLGAVSGIDDISSNNSLPLEIQLQQNYPNPFNPKTNIQYKLNKMNDIELSIYNTLGQKVAILVSERQLAGDYSVEWNAAGFSSGIYYYRLSSTSGLVQTKKLVLLK